MRQQGRRFRHSGLWRYGDLTIRLRLVLFLLERAPVHALG